MEIKFHNVEHIKTGKIYQVLDIGTVLDCTNSRDGTPVKVYYRDGKFFVRDEVEFNEKFADCKRV